MHQHRRARAPAEIAPDDSRRVRSSRGLAADHTHVILAVCRCETAPVQERLPSTERTRAPSFDSPHRVASVGAAAQRVLRDRDLHVLGGPTSRPFHAIYGEFEALVSIDDGSFVRGELPRAAGRLVREWIDIHRDELAANWQRAQVPEPLVPIEPLQ
ncbi:MAG: DUF4160 domain-containing protein [Acidimicrobiia bacterium]